LKTLISIVTYKNNLKLLDDVLSSLSVGRDKNIIISLYDNSASNDIKKIAVKHMCEYLESENIGFGSGHNQNILIQSSKNYINQVVILNPDVLITSRDIKTMLLKIWNKDIIISPNLLNTDHTQQDFVRKFPTFLSFFIRFFNMSEKFIFKDTSDNFHKVPFAHGACYICNLITFKKLGMFDTRFFMYCEDLDLCRAAYLEGNGVFIDGSINAIHHHNRESKRSIKLFLIHFVSILKYFYKWGFLLDSKTKQVNRLIN
jgi:GT2 family glycosyltransferase